MAVEPMSDRLRPRNALLRALAQTDWMRLRGELQEFKLDKHQVLAEMGDAVEWVVFPETGLISVISILISGTAVETSVVGREGAIGFIEALGSGRMHSRLLVQVPGTAHRIRSGAFQLAFEASRSMQQAVHRQVELLQAEGRLAIACHSVHGVQARLCRWLLECQDLSGGLPVLPLSQDLLAVMLAVQRTTITLFASQLQDEGLIRYRRGKIEILDRDGLEHHACECRATLQTLRAQLAPETFGAAAVGKA